LGLGSWGFEIVLSGDVVATVIYNWGMDATYPSGTLIPPSFELLELIGSGGFGQIYEARDTALGRRVAVKLLHRPDDDGWVKDFRREAAATAQLNHPNIVAIYHVGVWDSEGAGSVPFVVLERLEGESLEMRLKAERPSPIEAVNIAIEVARGLAHAHERGVVHRDLKPSNIHLGRDGVVKILDFGLADVAYDRIVQNYGGARSPDSLRAMLGISPRMAGSVQYLTPEQVNGETQGPQTDLWVLGFIFFEILTGRRPLAPLLCASPEVEIPLLHTVRPDLPPFFEPVLVKALRRAPSERYSSATELLAALEGLKRGLIELSDSLPPPYRYLDAFSEENTSMFFGRTQEVEKLYGKVCDNAFVTVLGASGAGKSSLVRAGLLGRVTRRGWHCVTFRPASNPLGQLLQHVATLIGEELELLAARVAQHPGSLAASLRRFATTEQTTVLLVIDQLEELYTRTTSSLVREQFIEQLLILGDHASSRLRVVVTLREDFLSRAAEHPSFHEVLEASSLILNKPDEAALRSALVQPAELHGYTFDPQAADELVNELSAETTPLPLLQLAASRLWELRDEERRTVGSEGRGVRVASFLSDHADEVVAHLQEQHRYAARELFLRLASSDGQTRQPCKRDEFIELWSDGGVGEHVLEVLTQKRLVTVYKDAAVVVVELAHESLLRWNTYQSWLVEFEPERLFLNRLNVAVVQWEQSKRKRSALWRGELLDEALYWRGRRGERWLGEASNFVEQSRAAATRSRKVLWAAVALLVVVLSGAALVSIFNMLKAQEQEALALSSADAADRAAAEATQSANVSRANELALAAKEALTQSDPVLSLLLAREAMAVEETEQAVYVLQQALADARELHLYSGHDDRVWRALPSPDGQYLATASWDGSARIWKLDGSPVATLVGHTDRVWDVAWDPDGTQVATASWDSTVRLWDLEGNVVTTFIGHLGRVSRVQFSPDGTVLASGGYDGVRLWRRDGKELAHLTGHAGRVRDLSFSPDGQFLATAGGRTVRVWGLDGSLRRELDEPTARDTVDHLEFSSSGEEVLGVSWEGLGTLWSVTTGEVIWSRRGSWGTEQAIALSPDGTLVAMADGPTLVLHSVSGDIPEIKAEGHEARIRGVRFSPDGQTVLTWAEDKTARLWTLKGRPLATFRGHTEGVWDARFVAGGESLVTAGDGTARLWSIKGQESLLLNVGATVLAVDYSPTQDRIIASTLDNRIFVWDGEGRLLRENKVQEVVKAVAPDYRNENLPIRGLKFMTDGESFVSGDDAGYLLRWSRDGEILGVVDSFEEQPKLMTRVLFIALAPSGKSFVASCRSGEKRHYAANGTKLSVMPGQPLDATWDMNFSIDEQWIASTEQSGMTTLWRRDGSESVQLPFDKVSWSAAEDPNSPGTWVVGYIDKRLRVWRDGKVIRTLDGHRDSTDNLEFTPSGEFLLSTSDDGRIIVWRLPEYEKYAVMEHGSTLFGATLSPDGGRILSWGHNGSVKLFSIDGREIAQLVGCADRVGAARFGTTRDTVLMGSSDGTVREYALAPDRLMAVAAQRAPRLLRTSERRRYNLEEDVEVSPEPDDCRVGQTLCDGNCVNLQRNGEQCGGCNSRCDVGQLCRLGQCVGACSRDEEVSCGGTCVDPRTEREHCGAHSNCLDAQAGRTCEEDEVCDGQGHCADQCVEGRSLCEGRCVDVLRDLENCGGCGQTCAADEVCQKGACSTMTRVDAGTTWMGCNETLDANCMWYELPQIEQRIPAFELDVVAVSNQAYQACVEAGVCTLNNLEGCQEQAPSVGSPAEELERPRVCVTQVEAEQYCDWLGKRLPSEAEQERAVRLDCEDTLECRTEMPLYPWGEPPISCERGVFDLPEQGCPLSAADAVSSKPEGRSDAGILNFLGNSMEWSADCWSDQLDKMPRDGTPRTASCSTVEGGVLATHRGSPWDQSQVSPHRNSFRMRFPREGQAHGAIGFRCARSVQDETNE